MRELSVYYCGKCGYYAYYQLKKHAVCPKCSKKMNYLDMPYQHFMDLNCEERDELLSKEILTHCSSVVTRVTIPHKAANQREIIAGLTTQVNELKEENEKLNETITWMHQTLWNMVKNRQVSM